MKLYKNIVDDNGEIMRTECEYDSDGVKVVETNYHDDGTKTVIVFDHMTGKKKVSKSFYDKEDRIYKFIDYYDDCESVLCETTYGDDSYAKEQKWFDRNGSVKEIYEYGEKTSKEI